MFSTVQPDKNIQLGSPIKRKGDSSRLIYCTSAKLPMVLNALVKASGIKFINRQEKTKRSVIFGPQPTYFVRKCKQALAPSLHSSKILSLLCIALHM